MTNHPRRRRDPAKRRPALPPAELEIHYRPMQGAWPSPRALPHDEALFRRPLDGVRHLNRAGVVEYNQRLREERKAARTPWRRPRPVRL